jgi:hypothetical protein
VTGRPWISRQSTGSRLARSLTALLVAGLVSASFAASAQEPKSHGLLPALALATPLPSLGLVPTPTPSPSPTSQPPPPPPPTIPTVAKSSISIRYQAAGGSFRGVVKSSEPRCVPERKVRLKKVRGDAARTVARTTARTSGKWSIDFRSPHGRFYAQTPQRDVRDDDGKTIVCRGARSRTIRTG